MRRFLFSKRPVVATKRRSWKKSQRGGGYIAKSQRSDWGTPPKLYAELHREFFFTVDAAAHSRNHKHDYYWDRKKNGLLQSWKGHSVFCNPPYGSAIADWVKKAAQSQDGNTRSVLLVPARTDTRWFHEYVYDVKNDCFRRGVSVRFLKGRIKFVGAKAGAPFPAMLVIFHAVM